MVGLLSCNMQRYDHPMVEKDNVKLVKSLIWFGWLVF